MKMKVIRDETWKSLASDSIKQNLPPILDHLDWQKRNQLVLDYGCGSGQVGVDHLLPKCRENDGQLFCLDKLTSVIKLARQNYPQCADIFYKGNILVDHGKEWPLEGKLFDKILAIDVLQHVYDLRIFFRKMYAQLNQGGQLGAIIPLDSTLQIKVRQLLGRIPEIGKNLENTFPVYGEWAKGVGSAQYVQGMVKEAGFSIRHFEIVQNSYTYVELHCLAAHLLSLLNESAFKRKLEDDWNMVEKIEDYLVHEIRSILNVPGDAKSITNVGHTLQIVVEKR